MIEKQSSSFNQRAVVADLDRTLFDTNKFVEMVGQAIQEFDRELFLILRQTQQKIEADGGSFNVLDFLQTNYPAAAQQLDSFLKDYSQTDDFLFPDAREMIRLLSQTDVPLIIMTRGGRQWQSHKIKAARLDSLPFLIIKPDDVRSKAEIINSWSNPSGQFCLPSELGRAALFGTLSLVEDKLSEVGGLNQTARGLVIDRNHQISSEKAEELAANISIVNNLEEIDFWQNAE